MFLDWHHCQHHVSFMVAQARVTSWVVRFRMRRDMDRVLSSAAPGIGQLAGCEPTPPLLQWRSVACIADALLLFYGRLRRVQLAVNFLREPVDLLFEPLDGLL